MLKSAISYLMQSGLRVQAGTSREDTLVIRIIGAKVVNLGDGVDFVPSEESVPVQGNVPSENQVQISDGTSPVPSNVPSEIGAHVPSDEVTANP